ncbi:CD209 antigen-like protein C isoform X6 [Oncorhynchus keta]|uniref:CD209 antigen-like protein C isoform X6 n=1 Tax=Oncorhynchus keta TaxID=8018 RepID=UPI00227D3788|nr:CD209 antigen-like protein C isoform X6 [Oncorhynchus keta]
MDRKHSKLLEMSEDIYAEPDMTKKVKFNRGEMKERIVDIYVSADTLRDGETSTKREETADTAPNNGPGDQHSDRNVSKNSSAERDQLETKYNNLTKEKDQLQASYNNLTQKRDQLQTRYNNLTNERDQLQTEKAFLKMRLTNLKRTCPEGWQKFESSWYFLSTETKKTKTWKESREDCLERGADLVIINSDKEQTFLFNLNKRLWIGLTDSDIEGTWKWVDGTPLITGYWYYPQPDNAVPTQNEDCVEIRNDQLPLKAWNDLSCDSQLNWICEKAF